MRDPGAAPAASPRAERLVRWALPLALFALHAATARGYGVFRDELYYFACGQHLDWGYVDHPPLVAVGAALSSALAGRSWIALRLISALAAGATALLAGDTARALGGGRFARLVTQLLVVAAPALLALCSTYSMNPLDLVVWAALFRLAARLLAGGDPRRWLLFGALAGVALEVKLSALYLGAGFVLGLLAARRTDVLRERRFWLAGGVAAALFAPYLVWQAAHGWPTVEFVANARRVKIAALAPHEYVLAQFVQAGPVGFALAIAGCVWLLAARRARPFRALGWAPLATLAVLAAGGSKPYYFAAAFTLLFPAAGVALEQWTAGARRRGVLRAAAVTAVAAQLALAPLAKPLLPVESYLRYAAALGFTPGSDERHQMGRLPQYFADMHGWRELAEAVAQVHRALPPAERERACVYAGNYGEAGAIDFFAPELGLPPAISGHNSYWLWGPGECTGAVLLLLGEPREEHADDFASVELGGVHRCADCMPYEAELPIWIGRGLRAPLGAAWSAVRHYD